jgi:hypothetical protein
VDANSDSEPSRQKTWEEVSAVGKKKQDRGSSPNEVTHANVHP